MKNVFRTLTLAFVLVVGTSIAAQASVVTWDNYTSASGVTVEAFGGDFLDKTLNGVSALGIEGSVDGEIGQGQSMKFTFDTPQIVNSLQLAFLYTEGNYGDEGDEVALLTAYVGGSPLTFTLTATTEGTGTLSGPGILSNLSLAQEGYGAVWDVENPFGTMAIEALVLSPGKNGSYFNDYRNSDFSFVSMTTTATPIPGAVWLLGSGLLGLLGLRRNRRV